jgi:hypothetical protein
VVSRGALYLVYIGGSGLQVRDDSANRALSWRRKMSGQLIEKDNPEVRGVTKYTWWKDGTIYVSIRNFGIG